MAGYLSTRAMFTAKEMEDPSPEMQRLVGRALNRVRVEAAHMERVQVRMERGSAVSGTVRFDDGSPAIGGGGEAAEERRWGQMGGDEAGGWKHVLG